LIPLEPTDCVISERRRLHAHDRGDPAMIKDIVVNLSPREKSDPAADYALSVARTYQAHIAGIGFAYEPVIAPVVIDISAEIIDAQRREGMEAAQAAVQRFDSAARAANLTAETRLLNATPAGAADMFGRIGRSFDISIVRQAEPDNSLIEEMIIEASLFESGRPVLIVPYIQREGVKLDRVIVCWDGSRTAARAIADAMPFLLRAKAIDVLTVSRDRDKNDEIAAADVGHHLARHGLKVEIRRIVAPDIDVASSVLSYVADASADLIVMGGYGHSRLREFILGGVTRGILSSMTVPTLMSH
jgi:nucleotide-binding universal stress UspA family protein